MSMFARSLGDDGAELRPLEPWRAAEFLDHMNRGREFIGQHIGLADVVTDLGSARAFLQSYADKTATDTGRIYGIWAGGTPLGSTLLGGVMFRTMDVAMGVAEAGCWLEPAGTGRGLITRACRLIIDWAVGERGLHRIEWQVAAANAASIAVAQRLGMSRDGVLRESYVRHGKRVDIELWSVLAPEWQRLRTA